MPFESDELETTDAIRTNLESLLQADAVYELRALETKKGTVSGYYTDLRTMASAAAWWETQSMGVYMTLNPVDPDLLARSQNKATPYAKHTTSDGDITCRRLLLIDLDPVRKSGISATDEEHDQALALGRRIAKYLSKKAWNYTLADSGNGAHVLVPVDLPNDQATTDLVKKLLQFLAFKFDDPAVTVDQSTFNLARISKIPGTLARKGSDTENRPHRRSCVLEASQSQEPVTPEQIAEIADLLPQPDLAPKARFTGNMQEMLESAGVKNLSTRPFLLVHTIYTFDCPFNEAHKPGKAHIIVWQNGAFAAGCRHNSCAEHKWADFKENLFPDWKESTTSAIASSAAQTTSGFKDIEPFDVFDRPYFPVEAFPSWLSDMVLGLSEMLQTPVEMAAVMALAVLATCVQGAADIEPTQEWVQPLNLYLAFVSPPGTRKSAVVSSMTQPLEQLEQERSAETASRRAEERAEKKVLEKRLEAATKKAADGDDDEVEMQTVRDLASRLEACKPQDEFRFFVDDCTPEKLAKTLSECGERLSVISAEGDALEIMMGRYGKESKSPSNIGIFLKGHTGEPHRVDRIGRESIHLKHPLLTFGLAIQPSVLSGIMGDETLHGRGLLARFAFCLPKDNVGFRRTDAEPISQAAQEAYAKHIRRLASASIPSEFESRASTRRLQLTPKARRLFDEFHEEQEKMMRPGAELALLKEWGAKMCGLVGRIAGLLHMANNAHDLGSAKNTVPSATVRAAIKIGVFFAEHTRAAYALLGSDQEIEAARKVLHWIKESQIEEFSRRVAHRALQSHFAKAQYLDDPLQLLEIKNYISRLDNTKAARTKGRPASPTYLVNPQVFESETPEASKYAAIQLTCLDEGEPPPP